MRSARSHFCRASNRGLRAFGFWGLWGAGSGALEWGDEDSELRGAAVARQSAAPTSKNLAAHRVSPVPKP